MWLFAKCLVFLNVGNSGIFELFTSLVLNDTLVRTSGECVTSHDTHRFGFYAVAVIGILFACSRITSWCKEERLRPRDISCMVIVFNHIRVALNLPLYMSNNTYTTSLYLLHCCYYFGHSPERHRLLYYITCSAPACASLASCPASPSSPGS